MSETTTADTATDTTTTTDDTTTADTAPGATTPDPAALATEVEKWKTLAQKHEGRAKSNADAAKELERIKREALPEQERLVAEAEARGSATATAKLAARIVDAEVKAAAAGRQVDIEALLEGLDRTRFLTTDGDPDTAAISAWVDRIAPKTDTTTTTQQQSPWPDLGQGQLGTQGTADPLLAELKSNLGIS